MTQTTQARSWAALTEAGKDLTLQKGETEDNRKLLLSVFEGLNNLYSKLERLNYLIQKRKIEQILYQKTNKKQNQN